MAKMDPTFGRASGVKSVQICADRMVHCGEPLMCAAEKPTITYCMYLIVHSGNTSIKTDTVSNLDLLMCKMKSIGGSMAGILLAMQKDSIDCEHMPKPNPAT